MSMFVVPAIMTAASIGASLFTNQQMEEEQQKTQMRNQRMSALMNMISVAGGHGVQGMPMNSPTTPSLTANDIMGGIQAGVNTFSMMDAIQQRDYQNQVAMAGKGASTPEELMANAKQAQLLNTQETESKANLANAQANYYNEAKGGLEQQKIDNKAANDAAILSAKSQSDKLAQFKAMNTAYRQTGKTEYLTAADQLAAELGLAPIAAPKPKLSIGGFTAE